jgi:hypothetical protein
MADRYLYGHRVPDADERAFWARRESAARSGGLTLGRDGYFYGPTILPPPHLRLKVIRRNPAWRRLLP